MAANGSGKETATKMAQQHRNGVKIMKVGADGGKVQQQHEHHHNSKCTAMIELLQEDMVVAVMLSHSRRKEGKKSDAETERGR